MKANTKQGNYCLKTFKEKLEKNTLLVEILNV